MQATTVPEAALIEEARRLIAERLPADWTVALEPQEASHHGGDVAMIFRGPQSSQGFVLVEARPRPPTPRDLRQLTASPLVRRLRSRSSDPILVMAPYLSPRSRDLLSEEDLSYADLTGNLRISLRSPGLFILTEGATRNPHPEGRRPQGLKGQKVGNIVRALVDVEPPYGVLTLAAAAQVSPGYVSRVLSTLEEEALIEREPRGEVTGVDWPTLLVQRAAELRLLAPEYTRLYVAREGPRATLDALGAVRELDQPPVVTGSFAVERRVRVAAPTLLVVYVANQRDADRVARALDLVPADRGADVALIAPSNVSVTDRAERDDRGFLWATESQLVIDCLSGPGRMPAEGEALIQWMRDHEHEWRRTRIDDGRPAGSRQCTR